jgi:hypothetical protein
MEQPHLFTRRHSREHGLLRPGFSAESMSELEIGSLYWKRQETTVLEDFGRRSNRRRLLCF